MYVCTYVYPLYMYFLRYISEFRVKARTGSETIHAAAVNGARPYPFHENDRLPRTRGKHRGRSSAMLVLPIIAQAARWRASPLRASHMYSRGWTKVIGDIMEAGGRTDGHVGGLSVPHVWTSQHDGNPFLFGLRCTDGRTDGHIRRRSTPSWKSLVRVHLRNNKTTAAPTRQARDHQNSATLSPDHHRSFQSLQIRGGSRKIRIFGGDNA